MPIADRSRPLKIAGFEEKDTVTALCRHLGEKGVAIIEKVPYLRPRADRKALFLAVPKYGAAPQMSAFVLWQKSDGGLELQALEEGYTPRRVVEDLSKLFGIAISPLPLILNYRHKRPPGRPRTKRVRWSDLVSKLEIRWLRIDPNT